MTRGARRHTSLGAGTSIDRTIAVVTREAGSRLGRLRTAAGFLLLALASLATAAGSPEWPTNQASRFHGSDAAGNASPARWALPQRTADASWRDGIRPGHALQVADQGTQPVLCAAPALPGAGSPRLAVAPVPAENTLRQPCHSYHPQAPPSVIA